MDSKDVVMQLSFFFGMIMFALLEVVRTQFQIAYGMDAKDSILYVVVVSCGLFIMFHTFPDSD